MAPERTPRARRARRPTATSAFGVSRRESHDASGFYARFEPPELSTDDAVHEPKSLDELYLGDSRAMTDVADGSVALVVTSPPYFAGKEYEEALGERHVPASYLEYLEMLTDVFAECARKLEPGGRLAVNVANLGRRPFRSLSADVVTILQDRLHLWLRGEVIWRKARGASGSCAWGSFAQPSNPVLRDVTERVVVASKGRLDRAVPQRSRERLDLPHRATVPADEFMEATLDLWELPAERASRVGHPAPFPVELPQRLIELHTYEGDLVLDPFVGSGTTCVAARRTGRHYVGYDTDAGYLEIARSRIAAEGATPAAPLPTRRAADVAREVLADAGLSVRAGRPRAAGGTDLAFEATDDTGRRWLVDVAGGFTVGPRGLRRSELLWRSLGRAAAARAIDPTVGVLVLTTGLPAERTEHARALRAAVGPVLHGVVDLTTVDAVAQVRDAVARA